MWAEVELPLDEPGAAPSTLVVELERGQRQLFTPAADDEVKRRFAEASRVCEPQSASVARSRGAAQCAGLQPGADHRAASEANGQKFCAHPEAKDARALFCRYPPRFYGHQGICRQYSQFCPFQEMQLERDPARIETAVVNVDKQLFYALQDCNILKEEVWIFKVFVHWCPHCQQLMPKLYRLGLALQQHGALRLRFGAVNCATEHDLCAEQKWMGHPLLVPKYTGNDRRIHDAVEHWADAVKDPQLREMLPRDAFPGEYPLLKVFLEQLPEEYAPKRAWERLFDEPELGEHGEPGACPNLTALHPGHPELVEDRVGNAWPDVEANITVRHRWLDVMLMLRHILKEWIVPLSDGGTTAAFSYDQARIIELWVGLLVSNLPPAFGLATVLRQLRWQLRGRLRAAQTLAGGYLCANDWKDMVAPVLKEIETVGMRDFKVGSACVSDTCRMWSLLHTFAGEGQRREAAAFGGATAVLLQGVRRTDADVELRPSAPADLLTVARDFLSEFFKCLYCRRHFLQQYDLGSYGLEAARANYTETVLYLWRLHNAVSVRVTAEHGCRRADRRWPPLSLCPECWDVESTSDWDVLFESLSLQSTDGGGRVKERGGGGGAAAVQRRGLRSLQMRALPRETEVFRFLAAAFSADPSAPVPAPPRDHDEPNPSTT